MPAIKHDKKRRPPLLQIGIAIVFLALIGGSFGMNVLAPAQGTPTIPRYLGSLALDHSMQGEEAMDEINKLHRTNIKLVNAVIAQYGTGNDMVMVWLGRAESRQAALDLITDMVKGIEKGTSTFSNPSQIKVGNYPVWQVDGPGGKFFFYESKDSDSRVVWVSVQSKNYNEILERAVKAF